MRLIKLKLARN